VKETSAIAGKFVDELHGRDTHALAPIGTKLARGALSVLTDVAA
jgi:hypothetical protein